MTDTPSTKDSSHDAAMPPEAQAPDGPPTGSNPGCLFFGLYVIALVFAGEMAFRSGGAAAVAPVFGVLGLAAAGYLGSKRLLFRAGLALLLAWGFHGSVLRSHDPIYQARRAEERAAREARKKAEQEKVFREAIQKRFDSANFRVEPKALHDEFAADEKAALAKYQDKWVVIPGVAQDVVLEGERPRFSVRGAGSLTFGVFFQADTKTLAGVKAGDPVEVRGKIVAYLLGNPAGVAHDVRVTPAVTPVPPSAPASTSTSEAPARSPEKIMEELSQKVASAPPRQRDSRQAMLELSAGQPIHLAIRLGDQEALRDLIAAGAPLDGLDLGKNTPLMLALTEKNPTMLRMLLEGGAKPVSKPGGYANTLHAAVSVGLLEAVEPLLAAGARPEVTDFQGKTALQLAEDSGRKLIAEALRGAPGLE